MNIELPPELVEQLVSISEDESRPLETILREAVEDYLQSKQQDKIALRTEVRQVIEENRWLIDELGKR